MMRPTASNQVCLGGVGPTLVRRSPCGPKFTAAVAERGPPACPPPDPKCDCEPTKDDNGCLLCMCHERVPPAQCPQVKCPVQIDNSECSVEMRDGCRVCNCASVDAAST
ncbi:uncharacterized protein LOC142587874 isoform X1 [Dermacentor variabilis]|uniref:uncharacterized protein LOC142587874 isoform X1 n=1 Tax=Dermacentor variabilis TaxID=34621 RepID=UPI003F5C74D6